MRKQTELTANARAQARTPTGFSRPDVIHSGTVDGGGNIMMPTALAMLAVAEVQFLYLIVKLSGCSDGSS